MKKDFDIGTKRIKSSTLKQHIKTSTSWDFLDELSENPNTIILFYSINNTLHYLIDEKQKEFLKGNINPENKISGARIKLLPNGTLLARAGFSLFAKNLKFNNDSNYDWDVCYENTSCLKTYLYSEDKLHLEQEKKFKLVQKFSENYNKIISTV